MSPNTSPSIPGKSSKNKNPSRDQLKFRAESEEKPLNHPCIILKCNCKVPEVSLTAHDKGLDVISADAVRVDRHEMLSKKKETNVIDVWSEEIRLQLERRGFVVNEAYHDGNLHGFLLTISRKRYQDLDMRYKNTHGNAADLDHLDATKTQSYRLRLAQYALDILKRVTDTNFEFHMEVDTLIHAYSYACIYSYIHMLIHTYTHTYIYSYIHILIHTYTHTYIYSYRNLS